MLLELGETVGLVMGLVLVLEPRVALCGDTKGGDPTDEAELLDSVRASC